MKTQTKYLHYKIGEHYIDNVMYILASRVDESDGSVYLNPIQVPVIEVDEIMLNKAKARELEAQIEVIKAKIELTKDELENEL